MNKIPTQQPQRERRPYQGRPIRLPKKCAPPKGLVISLVVTIVLLVISLMMLGIALLVGSPTDKDRDSDGGKRDPSRNEETQGAQTTPKRTANFLTLPSVTEGSVSSSADSPIRIEGISSAAAIVVDRSRNISLGEKEADTRIYPASMTKVMTVLVACENAKSPTDLLTVTEQMLNDLVTGDNQGASTIGGWNVGDQITVEDAIFLVNYQSDTIACWLLESYIPDFVGKMNAKAQSLALTNTHFVNSTGLHNENHYTTCREMAVIMNAALNNSAARTVLTSYQGYSVRIYRNEIFSRSTTQYAAWYSDDNRLNDNKFVGGGSEMIFIGGKTGFENIPSACFVTVAMDDVTKKEYICVTVGRLNSSQTAVSAAKSTADAKWIYRTYAEGN